MSKTEIVQIGEAKGRPMLHWVGKRPLDYVTAFPAQLVERFNPLSQETSEVSKTSEVFDGNLLFHGDNKDVLAWLLAPAEWRLLPHPIYLTWTVSLVTFFLVALLDRRPIRA